jgi:uncharacterized protein (TIGR01370 family)
VSRTLPAVALPLLLAVACSGSTGATGTPQPDADAHARIKQIRSFVTYYGAGRLGVLARYDLAIIQPSTLTPDEVRVLQARGTLVVAYLTIGEIDPGDPGLTNGTITPNWLLGTNRNWGSVFADARQVGWRKLVIRDAGDLLKQGYDGLFLDTVDTAEQFPATATGMVDLVQELHAAYPEALLVQNRGFTVIDRTASSVDAVMFEDLTTDYDFQSWTYTASPYMAENLSIARHLAAIHRRTGMPVLALDYVDPALRAQHARALHAVQVARSFGFIPSLSTIELTSIPDYGIALSNQAR